MKLRIIGFPHEAAAAVERLREVFDVIEVSDPYPCRGSERVRVYVEIRA